jgi:hypothetical protein
MVIVVILVNILGIVLLILYKRRRTPDLRIIIKHAKGTAMTYYAYGAVRSGLGAETHATETESNEEGIDEGAFGDTVEWENEAAAFTIEKATDVLTFALDAGESRESLPPLHEFEMPLWKLLSVQELEALKPGQRFGQKALYFSVEADSLDADDLPGRANGQGVRVENFPDAANPDIELWVIVEGSIKSEAVLEELILLARREGEEMPGIASQRGVAPSYESPPEWDEAETVQIGGDAISKLSNLPGYDFPPHYAEDIVSSDQLTDGEKIKKIAEVVSRSLPPYILPPKFEDESEEDHAKRAIREAVRYAQPPSWEDDEAVKRGVEVVKKISSLPSYAMPPGWLDEEIVNNNYLSDEEKIKKLAEVTESTLKGSPAYVQSPAFDDGEVDAAKRAIRDAEKFLASDTSTQDTRSNPQYVLPPDFTDAEAIAKAQKTAKALSGLPSYAKPPGWADDVVNNGNLTDQEKIKMLADAADAALRGMPGYEPPPSFDEGEHEQALRIIKEAEKYTRVLPSYTGSPEYDDDEAYSRAMAVHDALMELPQYAAPPGWDDEFIDKGTKAMLLAEAADKALSQLPGYDGPPSFEASSEQERTNRIIQESENYAKLLPGYFACPGYETSGASGTSTDKTLALAVAADKALRAAPGYSAPPAFDDDLPAEDKIQLIIEAGKDFVLGTPGYELPPGFEDMNEDMQASILALAMAHKAKDSPSYTPPPGFESSDGAENDLLKLATAANEALRHLPSYRGPPSFGSTAPSAHIDAVVDAGKELLKGVPEYALPPRFDDMDEGVQAAIVVQAMTKYAKKASPSYTSPPGFDDDEPAHQHVAPTYTTPPAFAEAATSEAATSTVPPASPPSGPVGVLDIKLVGGKNLIAMDEFPFSSDPFVMFCLGDEMVESSVMKNTLDPEWNELFSLPIYSTTEVLEISVMDQDEDEDNDPMGNHSIPINVLFPKKPLALELKLKDVDRGSLFVVLTAKADFTPQPDERTNAIKARMDTPAYVPPPAFGADWDGGFNPDDKARGTLEVTVKSASNLVSMDAFPFTSDPFVVLELGSEVVKTKVIKNNVNPKFGEGFKIPIRNYFDSLKITVKDWDEEEEDDDFLGRQSIDVLGLVPYESKEITLTLRDIDQGEITLVLCAKADFQSTGTTIGASSPSKGKGKPPGWVAPPGWSPPTERSAKISSRAESHRHDKKKNKKKNKKKHGKAPPAFKSAPTFDDGGPSFAAVKAGREALPEYRAAPDDFVELDHEFSTDNPVYTQKLDATLEESTHDSGFDLMGGQIVEESEDWAI